MTVNTANRKAFLKVGLMSLPLADAASLARSATRGRTDFQWSFIGYLVSTDKTTRPPRSIDKTGVFERSRSHKLSFPVRPDCARPQRTAKESCLGISPRVHRVI